MTSIDCLLKNTEVVEAVKTAMEYIGVHKASEGKDASLATIYGELRKNGVEIDLNSAAHIYKDVLTSKDHPAFSTREEADEIAGKYFDDLTRNLILREDKTGEQQISELSPAQAAVKALTRAFTNPLVTDARTKSILKTMQDAYTQYAKRMAGKTPEEETSGKDTRSFEQVVQDALDKESLGYPDRHTGELLGFDKLDAGAKEIMKKLDREVAASGDEVLKAQWDEYAKSLENSVRTLMLSTKEGKKVLYDALKSQEGGGFVKTLKDGTEVLDHQALAGNIGSITQYRENVVNALTESGFTKEQAEKVSDSLQKEYYELRGKSLETLRKSQEQKQASFEPAEAKPKVSVGDMVNKAIKASESYKGLTSEAKAEGVDTTEHNPQLTFSKKEANTIVFESLKNSDKYGKQVGDTGDRQIDWRKLAVDKPTPAELNKLIAEHLKNNEKVDINNAIKVADNLLGNKAHDNLLADIDQHSETNLTAQQNALSKDIAPVNRSEMTRLAELHAMGIFNGAHDDLLHHVLGIDGADQATRKKLIDLFEKKQQLIQQLGSHEFLYHSLDASLQHEVNQLIEENVADKGKVSRIAKAIFDYQSFVNMGIIANPFNIAENTISGFQANAGQTIGLMKQMGVKEGVKIFYEMSRLWAATLKDVAKGGIHYGLESGKFSQSSGIADKLTFKNWDKLNPVQKIATTAIAYAHMGLNAMDSAYKVSIHQKTTMLNLHKALTDIPDQYGRKMTKDEASEYLNEHLFGNSLEQAKAQAEKMYKQLGLKYDKNSIERSAREIVQANIFSDGHINDDLIEAAMRGAYQVAAVGLGHTARPGVLGWLTLAPMMKGMQTTAQAHYDKLLKAGKYDQAAWFHMGVQSVVINGVFKFAHGVANWMLLRPLTAGLGLVTGTVGKQMGKSDVIDYTDKKQLEEAFYKYGQANADINRAIVGLSMFALQAGALSLYGAAKKEDQDKENMAAGFEAVKQNPILNKAMNKFGADMLALMYASYTAKQHGRMRETYANIQGFGKYVEGMMNIGSGMTLQERTVETFKLMSTDNEKAQKKAHGILGEMVRTVIPGSAEVPFYRSYKGAYYLGKSAAEQKAQLPPFYNPQSLMQGMMDNGIINDLDETLGLGIMFPKQEESAPIDVNR